MPINSRIKNIFGIQWDMTQQWKYANCSHVQQQVEMNLGNMLSKTIKN